MNKKTTVLFIIVILAISGCGMIAGGIVTLNLPSSKYSRIDKGIDEYYSTINDIDGVVVKDKLGTYYHKKIDRNLFLKFVMLNEDFTALRHILSSSYGIMEPVYSYDENVNLYLNWKETERRYKYFTNELGLKLSPLNNSMEYHKLIIASAKDMLDIHRKSGGFAIGFASFSGENGLYNPKYFEKIISKIIKNETYIISNTNTPAYYFQVIDNDGAEKALHKRTSAATFNAIANDLMLPNHYSINFVPIDYFMHLSKGGGSRSYSGCSFTSKEAETKQAEFFTDYTAIPYISAINMVIKEKNMAYQKKSKQRYLHELNKYKSRQGLAEEACKIGFKEIGLSGFIESQRLQVNK